MISLCESNSFDIFALMKIENQIARGIIKAVVAIVALATLLYWLYAVKIIFVYIAIALVITVINRPLVLFLHDKLKIPNAISAMLAILLSMSLIAGVVMLFIPLITQQAQNLAIVDPVIVQKNIERELYSVLDFFKKQNIDYSKNLNINTYVEKLTSIVPDFINGIVEFLSTFFIGTLSVLFISFFLLKDRLLIKRFVFGIVPDDKERHFNNVLDKTNNFLSRYFIGLIMQCFGMFILYVIILSVLGVGNTLIIAFICAIFNLIPYIGPLIGSIVISFFTTSHFIGEGLEQTVIIHKLFYLLVAYFVAQLIDNFIYQPLIFSKSVRSHPLEIFLVIIIGGILFGVLGMIIAVPAYTTLRVILKEFFGDVKWVKALTKGI